MKQTKIIMGMPVTVDIPNSSIPEKVFDYFRYVDAKFSTYKKDSEISKINRGELTTYSADMALIFKLAEETKQLTGGYFDIYFNGKCDPSGIVKGWAINNAAKILKADGYKRFYVDAGGDIQTAGGGWRVGIKNPFNQTENVKIIKLDNQGIATSGIYIRGDHIYNPITKNKITDIISLTVIAPNVYEADRIATAAYAMGKEGIVFIEKLPGFEGYLIDDKKIATYTSGFSNYGINR